MSCDTVMFVIKLMNMLGRATEAAYSMSEQTSREKKPTILAYTQAMILALTTDRSQTPEYSQLNTSTAALATSESRTTNRSSLYLYI